MHEESKLIIQINFTILLIVFFCTIYTMIYATTTANFGDKISILVQKTEVFCDPHDL